MPITPRHPYQDIPYVGPLGVDPFIGVGPLQLTNPLASPATAALIGKFAQRFPKVWEAITRKLGDVSVRYPMDWPVDPTALGTATLRSTTGEGLGITVRGGGRPQSGATNTLLHEVLHLLQKNKPQPGYPPNPYARVIAEKLGKPLTRHQREALDAEDIEMLLGRLAGRGAGGSAWGEAAIEKMAENIARRSRPMRFP